MTAFITGEYRVCIWTSLGAPKTLFQSGLGRYGVTPMEQMLFARHFQYPCWIDEAKEAGLLNPTREYRPTMQGPLLVGSHSQSMNRG